MTLREERERLEYEILSGRAVKSRDSLGRDNYEPPCPIRTAFCRDRDRITHSKSFRRLMHKTQVFISPEGDHFRTRLTHTLEVAQIARTISRALKLNEDLTEAIALGHDLGHTPFGHAGEEVLDKIMPGGFRHNEQSVRMVKILERGGRGLNLTREVIDGIEKHRLKTAPITDEGMVVRISDKIAYINHDIDDAVRAGMLKPEDLPKDAAELLGKTPSERINNLILSVIGESAGGAEIKLGKDEEAAMYELREFMYRTVYQNQLLTREREKIYFMFEKMFESFVKEPSGMPPDFIRLIEAGETRERAVCDYIACMTDRYALNLYMSRFVPHSGLGVRS